MNTIQTLIPWTPFLPLLGALILGIFGKKIQQKYGENITGIIGCATPFLAAIIAFISFFYLISLDPSERVIIINLADWFSVANFQVAWTFRYDPLSAMMLMIITGIGTLIHIYSMGYMQGDKSFWRFFAYINLFLASMLLLVLGDNLIIMFLGWEGVGLCSYLLIGFWFTEKANAVAGKKAFIVNRIGDLGFLTGIFLIFYFSAQNFELVSLSFGELEGRVDLLSQFTIWGMPLLEVIAFCFFIGATGKSAQIPLHIWLPDAMAGPTPVSALIHAATMVTAGVYMIARMYFLFALAPNVLFYISIIAAITCFFAATIGMAQYDIKKVLAYSTLSQLGYMFLAMGVGAFSAGVFHLLTHAAFKAALFMGSGAVIVAMHHEQDMRYMGGLLKKLPATGWSMIAGTLAIMGFPLTSGFFSKDEILWKAWIQGSPALWLVGFLAAGITSFYMWRLIFMTFFGPTRASKEAYDHCHEQPKRTIVPIMILAVVSLTIGFLNVPHFLGGHSGFTEYLTPSLVDVKAPEGDHTALEWGLMLASVAWTFLTGSIAYYFYIKNPEARAKVMKKHFFQDMFKLLYNKYYIDEIYEKTILDPIRRLYLTLNKFDQKVIDGVVNFMGAFGKMLGNISGKADSAIVDGAVNGTAWLTNMGGKGVSLQQSGRIQVLVGASVILLVLGGIYFLLLL